MKYDAYRCDRCGATEMIEEAAAYVKSTYLVRLAAPGDEAGEVKYHLCSVCASQLRWWIQTSPSSEAS